MSPREQAAGYVPEEIALTSELVLRRADADVAVDDCEPGDEVVAAVGGRYRIQAVNWLGAWGYELFPSPACGG